LVDDGLDATCVFACNDVMAVGAIAAFRDNGLRVPQDVSVAGFDDIKPLRDLVPQLTTVHLDLEELGERAATLALDSSPENRPQLVRVRGTVVLRDSTRRVSGRDGVGVYRAAEPRRIVADRPAVRVRGSAELRKQSMHRPVSNQGR
jgi:ABC-type sugar transport system substrate-binding protein